ncbi:hypothetical protein F5Y00DRAFT_272480 [Daldinia vernicosa]|uniref:uncharacterized protein n=1 Tax=Daldinia vernicosa TaxID=114800 RepID=UPI002008A79D|nr:uncharacterized protein F5Y00DRAFT_272480 [Daldinia vernicosa]KAI0852847.1 hypothetical protein F5Y00DRAFT_272480 [Daldinia vernicosa]
MKKIATEDTCLILASEDFVLSETNFTPWADTYIFTNQCMLSTAKVKTKNLQLNTSSFVVNATNATIDASGEDGEDNMEELAKTADGHTGYHIVFSSARWYPDEPMSLSVKGGDGRSGWSGLAQGKNGGKGGDGGPGGTVYLLYSDTFQLVNAAAGDWFYEKDDEKKKAKVADWIEYCKTMITCPQTLVDLINKYADGYRAMSAADAGERLFDLTTAIASASVAFENSIRINYAGGLYGHGGSGTPHDGANGESGSIGSSTTVEMYNQTIPSAPHILFHPDQIAMTLRDIENDYFLGSSDSIMGCARSLRIMLDRLSFFANLKPTDALFQAYQKEEGKLFILHSGTDTPTSITSIAKSLEKAQRYFRQIGSGLDLYGHVPAWVPRGSYDFYKRQLDDILSGFTDIETNYVTFQQEAITQVKKRDVITHSKATARTLMSRARQDIARLNTELGATSIMIQSLPTDFKVKREALMNSIKAAGNKIDQNKFSVSLPDFLAAAAQFAFAPGLPMASIQAASLITGGVTQVQDDNDTHVNKAYLVNKIMAIKADMDGLKEGLTVGPGGDSLTIDDPGAAKLLVEEHSLMALIGQYRGLLGDSSVTRIKAKFEEYVNTVLMRNNYVIRYNAVLTLIAQSHGIIDSQQHQLDLLARQSVHDIDPDLPGLAVFVEQVFFDAAAQVLKVLYRAERALTFWTLAAPVSNLSTLRQGGFVRPNHGTNSLYSSFVSAKNNIIAAYADAIENSTNQSQKFGDSIPIKVYLSQDDLADLQTGVYVTLPAARSTTQKVDNPFADCADVRLSRVRFYVKGAKTSDSMLDVSLEHMGNETVVDVNDGLHVFVHNALHFKFQYNLDTGAIQTDGDMASLVNKELALPGPFAQWRIAVNDSYNNDLDMSEVTDAWFEFSGWSRSFG